MLKFAAEGAASSQNKPILLGVTILTSTGEEELKSLGIDSTVENKVIELAKMAKRAGMNGVVASSKEVKKIKETIGEDFIVVTPGIRPEWAAKGDQKRVLSPKKAIEEGADYIVVGRPIIQADDPLEAANKIINEMK